MSPLLSSLAGFLSAGLRPSTPLSRAVVTVLVAKLCAVVAMRLFLFNDGTIPDAGAATRLHLLGGAAVASERSIRND
ncbi:MAG: hypothetical protein F8N37_09505 [Telmatospirillum sp.]|nr:hypothetical protein [Telmatospirillum sp.]